jgi:hypothetical protein
MKKQYLVLLVVAGLLTFFSACKKEAGYKTLIITGQNNHNWKASSPVLKQILDETGLFTSEIMITPDKGIHLILIFQNTNLLFSITTETHGPIKQKPDSLIM